MGIAERQGRKSGGLSARKKSTAERLSGSSGHGAKFNKLKPIIISRDNHTCKKCGKSKYDFPDIILTVDHIIPVASGGRTVASNLHTVCIDCHINKLGKKNKRGAKLLTGTKNRIQKERYG